MFRVVTDLAIMGFDKSTKAMKIEALHPGVTVEEVRDNTGFDILVNDNPRTTEAPTDEELSILRHLDPDRLYIA